MLRFSSRSGLESLAATVRLVVVLLPFGLPFLTLLIVASAVESRLPREVSPRFFEVGANVSPVLLLALVLQSRVFTGTWLLRGAVAFVGIPFQNRLARGMGTAVALALVLAYFGLLLLALVGGEVLALKGVATGSTSPHDAAFVAGGIAACFMGIMISAVFGLVAANDSAS
jgi:hypothetical protein